MPFCDLSRVSLGGFSMALVENVTAEMADLKQQEVLALLATIADIQPLKDIALAMELEVEGVETRKSMYRLVANYINSDDFENLEVNERYGYLQNARITIEADMVQKEEEDEKEEVGEKDSDSEEEEEEEIKDDIKQEGEEVKKEKKTSNDLYGPVIVK